MNTTIDSDVYPALESRDERKTTLRWTDRRTFPTASSATTLRLVRRVEPEPAWAPPPPIVTRKALAMFQLALAGVVLVSVFAL